MTQLSTWGKAWGQAWGDSWGKLEESSQGKSGVQRLWMYELYAQSIEEDHKKRGLIKDEPAAPVTVDQPVLQGKKQARKRRIKRLEQTPVSKPLPIFARTAPVFIKPPTQDLLDRVLADIKRTPLPSIKSVVNKPVKQRIKDRRKEDEEEFLLLAAA